MPDPASAAIVTEASKLRVAGASHGKIVEYLGAALGRGVAKSTVTAMLRNRAYLGEARGPGEGNVKVGAHEPLVDEELFARVQVRTGTRSTKTGSVSSQAILGGLITCASCGHKLRVLGSPSGGASYVCHAKYAGGNCAEPAAARVKLVDAHVVELMAGAWDEVTARSADAAQRFVQARERVAKLATHYYLKGGRMTTAAPAAPTKTVQRLIDRHSNLKDEFTEAYAAVETSDDAPDSPAGKKLQAQRDKAGERLHEVVGKLRAAGRAPCSSRATAPARCTPWRGWCGTSAVPITCWRGLSRVCARAAQAAC